MEGQTSKLVISVKLEDVAGPCFIFYVNTVHVLDFSLYFSLSNGNVEGRCIIKLFSS